MADGGWRITDDGCGRCRGSGVSPCGYNAKYTFGICVAYTSLVGMNCSLSEADNEWAVYEATCLVYDAVLAVAGGTRLNCSVPSTPLTTARDCRSWDRVNHSMPFRPPFSARMLATAQCRSVGW